ncbi:MAG: hypothetical protein JSV33_06135 [bacterium]|nr:MAG: hypothetical protein JSV33_06135 [bacterium]
MLIRDRTWYPDRIAYEIYQAPNLTGFHAASYYSGFYFTGISFDIVIDGWSIYPTTRSEIKLIFIPIPQDCSPTITIDGEQVTGPPYRVFLGDLVVSTPVVTPTGTYYSDTMTKSIEWSGCIGMYMFAYEDCDHDHQWLSCGDCEEETNCCLHCHQLCAHGAVVPVEQQTWGAIKSLYK